MNTLKSLARKRLTKGAIFVIIIGGVAPSTVSSGIFPSLFGLTGITQLPLMLLIGAALLMLVSVGYVAMSGRVRHTGAFYAFIAKGLLKPLGVAAGYVSVATYVMLHAALYGAVGFTAAQMMSKYVNWPWWVWSAIVLGIVAFGVGPRGVQLSKNVMLVLVTIEIVVLILLSLSGLLHPAHGYALHASFSPVGLTWTAASLSLVGVWLSFTGFEQGAIHSETAVDHVHTVRWATFLALIGMAGVYTLNAFAQVVHYGPGQVAAVGLANGPETMFQLGNPLLAQFGRVSYLTSLIAAILAFHFAGAHYFFALGRERVLPLWMANSGPNGPRAGSYIQSACAAVIIAVFAVTHGDPQLLLFFGLGTLGGLSIMLLITVTMAAVIGFYLRNPDFRTENWFVRVGAPLLSLLILVPTDVVAVTNFNDLLGGSADTKPFTVFGILTLAVVACVGFLVGVRLKFVHPDVYERIGTGAQVTVDDSGPIVSLPVMREGRTEVPIVPMVTGGTREGEYR
jgi:amino acid transporter